MDHQTPAETGAPSWNPQPRAAAQLQEWLDQFLNDNSWTTQFANRLRDETGTRLFDWIDHLAMPIRESLEKKLDELNFTATRHEHVSVWQHPQGLFPAVALHDGTSRGLAMRVESVADFLTAHGLDDRLPILGEPLSAMRRALVAEQGDTRVWVVERHGYDDWEPPPLDGPTAREILHHSEAFRRRRRDFSDDADGFKHAQDLIRTASAELGTNRACDVFFSAEREYWQRRNDAAVIQKRRQDALGMGWANHDHHTYRSSRANFRRLIELLEELGCECRERFYAGAEAGWGAQVLEQRACRIVIFADVDLTPDEVAVDFAHQSLLPREQVGTVGLWCELHGEAFLQAGMHHLECQFDFERAQQQLAEYDISTMPPFTDFEYLKQAFTQGQMWQVAPGRLEAALNRGYITVDQAENFRRHGALGSHLEILQRDDGYKGFNQTGISEIILKTDPRRQTTHGA